MTRSPITAVPLWRQHADAVNARLLLGLDHGSRLSRVLKTDLFEESVGRGLVPSLAGMADEVHGIDVDPVTLAEVLARHPFLLGLHADVRRLPFPDDHFDAVVSTSTLDHFNTFAEVRDGLQELHRVLRPGGALILTLDNLANPVVWLRNAMPFSVLRRLGLVPYFVGATCGPRRLRCELREAGFSPERLTANLHCPRAPAILLARWLDGRGERRRRRFLDLMGGMERLERWPTRYLTGYYVAVRTTKP